MTHVTDPQKLLAKATAALRAGAERERGNLTKLRNYDTIVQTAKNRKDTYVEIKRALFGGSERNDLSPAHIVHMAQRLYDFKAEVAGALDANTGTDLIGYAREIMEAYKRALENVKSLRTGVRTGVDRLDEMRAAVMDLLKVDPSGWTDQRLLDRLRAAWHERSDRTIEGGLKTDVIKQQLDTLNIPPRDDCLEKRITTCIHRYDALRKQLMKYYGCEDGATDGHLTQQVKAGDAARAYREAQRMLQRLVDIVKPSDPGIGFGLDDLLGAVDSLKKNAAVYRKQRDELREGIPTKQRDRVIVEAVKAERDQAQRTVDELCELMGYPLAALPDVPELKRKVATLLTEHAGFRAQRDSLRADLKWHRHATRYRTGDKVTLTPSAAKKHCVAATTFEVMQVFDTTAPVHYVVGMDSRILVYETELKDRPGYADDPLVSVLAGGNHEAT